MELDTTNFNLLIDAARSAGSFRELAPFDQVFFAKAGDEELRVEAFGCRLKISSLLNIDPKGGRKDQAQSPVRREQPGLYPYQRRAVPRCQRDRGA